MNTYDNPPALRVVAALFVFSGVCALIEVVLSFFHSHLNLNLGVLSLWIGPGLLRHSRTWRMWALIFLWLGLIGIPVFCFLALNQGALNFQFFGVVIGHVPASAGIALAIPLFLILLWEYRVLTCPDIKALFDVN